MIKLSMSIKSFAILVIISVYTLFYSLWLFNIDSSGIDNYATTLFPWIIAALLVQLWCFIIIKKVSMIDIGLWFVLLSYLFMYGYLFIDYFDLQSSLLWTPIREYDQSLLFKAASFVNLSMNLFSLGYLLVYKNDRLYNSTQEEKGELCDIRKYRVGVILCIIGGICQLITSMTLIIVTQNAGSYTAYSQAASSGLIDDISFLFVPGVIYILSSKKMNVSKALAFTGMVVIYFSVIMLLSGSRKTQVFGILAVALCYLYTYRPPKVRLYKKILIVVAGIVFLNMIYVIRENRMNLSQVVPEFFKSLTNFEFLESLIPEILAETGITFCSVASVMQCVPRIFPFEYGIPILRSIVSIVPIGWLLPDFFTKASTTTTINSYLDLPVGASLFGDFYWNWGMFGIAFAFVFGIILAVSSVRLRNKSSEIYFSLFYIILIGVRAGVFEIARPLFIVSFVPLFLGWIMRRKY